MTVDHVVVYGHSPGEEFAGISTAQPTKLSVKPELNIKLFDLDYVKKPMAATTGFHVTDASMVYTDQQSPTCFAAAMVKRVGSETNKTDKKIMRKFERFVKNFLEQNLEPLAYETDFELDTWLEKTHYTQQRKDDLRKIWRENLGHFMDKETTEVKCFLKDECYSDFKYARAIMARSDLFKCYYGPYIKAIEEEVYKLPWFIKHVPECERPKHLTDMLHMDGVNYFVSDHTSFEAAFTPEIMRATEFQLYSYMTKHLIQGNADFMRMNYKVLGQINNITSRLGQAKCTGRMSGEMCTSLGNGFANLMSMLFILEEAGASNIAGEIGRAHV